MATPLFPIVTSAPMWRRAIQPAAIVALLAALAFMRFHHDAAPPAAPPRSIVERVVDKATGALDRPTALAALQKNAAAIAVEQTTAVVVSGSSSNSGPDTLSAFLRSRGFIACGPGTGPLGISETVCNLTPKGRAQHWQASSVANLFGGHDTRIAIPLASVEVERVTGISGGPVGYATGSQTADFVFVEHPNALGADLIAWSKTAGKHCGTNYPAQWKDAHAGSAVFNRFDDGQRLVSVSIVGESLLGAGTACL